MKRAFKQRVVAKSAAEEGRILLEGEPPGTIACHTVQYNAEVESYSGPMFALELMRQGDELRDNTVEVKTEEVRYVEDEGDSPG